MRAWAFIGALFAAALVIQGAAWLALSREVGVPIATHDAGTTDGGSTMIAAEPVWRAEAVAVVCGPVWPAEPCAATEGAP